MPDQGKTPRTVLALCSVVVAACALTVTIKVVATDTHPLLDADTVARTASASVRGHDKATTDGVTCPAAIRARKGTTFTCLVSTEENPTGLAVDVKIVDDQGTLSAPDLSR